MIAKILFGICIIGLDLIFVPEVRADTCWDTTWYNNSSPSQHNGSEFQTLQITVLDSICPAGKTINDIRCKGGQEEIFQIFKDDTVNKYIALCTVINGLQCHPYNNTDGAACVDFAIQYGCACTTTPSPQNMITGPATSEQRTSDSKTNPITKGSLITTPIHRVSVDSTSQPRDGSYITSSLNELGKSTSGYVVTSGGNGPFTVQTGYMSDRGTGKTSTGSGLTVESGRNILNILGGGSTGFPALGCSKNGSKEVKFDFVLLLILLFICFADECIFLF